MRKLRRRRELEWDLSPRTRKIVQAFGMQGVINGLMRYTFIGEFFERLAHAAQEETPIPAVVAHSPMRSHK